ncbi:hypothetical protein NLI96_g4215 [Meripilus lineatus]|uniref:Uncharacterized protein n=1 Tax=Meripilus lineatus TaxID=2056292 RepID=A0AAD5V7J3_9APHY|nr:hypothetical protein NLI96_g4215 [Physisporinus lineatus]
MTAALPSVLHLASAPASLRIQGRCQYRPRFDFGYREVPWTFQTFEIELALITVGSELLSPHLLLNGTPFAVQLGNTATSVILLRSELSPEFGDPLLAAIEVDDSSILVPK